MYCHACIDLRLLFLNELDIYLMRHVDCRVPHGGGDIILRSTRRAIDEA